MEPDLIIAEMNQATPVVFLHGFGSTATVFQEEWKRAGWKGNGHFINGIERDEFSKRYRWFPFTTNQENLSKYITNAASLVEKEILKLGTDTISVVGHSQGAMIALELLLRNKIKIKHLWSFCGFLPTSLLRPLNLHTSPNIYFYYSEADKYIGKELFKNTYKFFSGVTAINIMVKVSQNLEHAFSREWLMGENY
jgi:predicted esterase